MTGDEKTLIAQEELLGARISGNGEVEFRVWAPAAREVRLRFQEGQAYRLPRNEDAIFSATIPARAGDRYFYSVDGGRPVPDPVSRLLPDGVHGPTEIIDPAGFAWSDHNWRGIPLRDYLIYELHTGTFSPQGTFAGIIDRLDYFRKLGVTVLEIMPVTAFPGQRNWGYDGASLYSVHAGYGGPDGLKRLVDAAHAAGLAIILDVVYNHLGNEGNYLRLFGPYFTDRHQTPWGEAINYDGPGREGVRSYFIQNALYWIREYHFDGLRLDAVQTIKDDSPYHIVEEIRDRVKALAHALDREVCVIAETDENDARLARPKQLGGFALDAVWSDDFHHALHAVLTGERAGYYQDFGEPEQLVRALNEGFVFQGEYFRFWQANRGTPPAGVPLPAHVICTQNHDQVGNRALGERLTRLVPEGARYLAAAVLLLAPETPLLFMGQEYDESAPFQFFTDFTDRALQKAVSEGRRREFKDFRWDEVPDPQDAGTFARTKLNWALVKDANAMLRWYRKLIELRRLYVVRGERTCRAEWRQGRLRMQVPAEEPRVMVIASFPGAVGRSSPPPQWSRTMAHEQDGFGIAVYLKNQGKSFTTEDTEGTEETSNL